MRYLIEDLLRLSQVTSAELSRTDFDLGQMVRSIVDELRRQEPEREVDIVVEDAVRCSADPKLLRIALQNLLGNAWKFTRKTPDARIEFGVDDKPRTYFIRDNGAGFDEAEAADMFAPFRRLHSESDFPGTGVGLSIVQRIIRKHGGTIVASGKVGAGANFTFTL
jgi:signal transduction histidine kinase